MRFRGSLILTSYGRPGHLKRALAAGVRGFLPKTGLGAANRHEAVQLARSRGWI